jgi:hypothetical protein
VSWGLGAWGKTPWGGVGPPDYLALVGAVPVRENVVRLSFNQAPYFSGVLDPSDASNRFRYTIVPDPTSADPDGLPPRLVSPAVPEVAPVPGAAGSAIDLTLDRRMSAWPARYLVSVNGMRASASGALLMVGGTSAPCDGLAAVPPPPDRDKVAAGSDFANPQSRLGLGDNVPLGAKTVLGAYPVDASGDYASDRGLASYRKRVVRRLAARLNGFAHLAGYGLGAVDRVKRLDRGGDAETLAKEAEAQVMAEPETAEARVSVERSSTNPSVVVLRIRARTRSGSNVDMGVPFANG